MFHLVLLNQDFDICIWYLKKVYKVILVYLADLRQMWKITYFCFYSYQSCSSKSCCPKHFFEGAFHYQRTRLSTFR